jgi:hypothetical protein
VRNAPCKSKGNAPYQDRTGDLQIMRLTLYQLSQRSDMPISHPQNTQNNNKNSTNTKQQQKHTQNTTHRTSDRPKGPHCERTTHTIRVHEEYIDGYAHKNHTTRRYKYQSTQRHTPFALPRVPSYVVCCVCQMNGYKFTFQRGHGCTFGGKQQASRW